MLNIVRSGLLFTVIFVIAPISALALGPGGGNPPPTTQSSTVTTLGPGGGNPPPTTGGASTIGSTAYTILTTILSDLGF